METDQSPIATPVAAGLLETEEALTFVRETFANELALRGCPERQQLQFRRLLLADELPQSIGGGIEQSWVCMFLLRKAHIGEVQVSIWPEAVRHELAKDGIELL